MAIGVVIAFWGVSFLLVLVPGADWAYAIAAGLRDRSVLPAVAGLLAGYVALTAVVAAGRPVGPGEGSGWSGFTSGAGVAGEVRVAVTRCVRACVLDRPDPHPTASNAIVMTAMH